MSDAVTPAGLEACTQFVYEEAELLDSGRYEDWLALFADQCRYWLPMRYDQAEAADELNLIYDDRARLEDRVARLQSGFSFAEEPASRTSHLISNVRILGGAEAARLVDGAAVAADDLAVGARSVIARARNGTVEQFHARLVWLLRPSTAGLRIAVKRVDLLNASDPLPLLTFLL